MTTQRNPLRERVSRTYRRRSGHRALPSASVSWRPAQLGRTQPGLEASGRAACRLAIEQQRQPFGVGEITGLVLRLQLDEGIGHAVELEGSKLVDRWVCEHR